MLTRKEEIPKECYPSNVPYKVTATEWNLQQICKLSCFYLQLSNVADIMLSTPVSNAWPERGASCLQYAIAYSISQRLFRSLFPIRTFFVHIQLAVDHAIYIKKIITHCAV